MFGKISIQIIINNRGKIVGLLTLNNHHLPALIHSLIPIAFHGVAASACFMRIPLNLYFKKFVSGLMAGPESVGWSGSWDLSRSCRILVSRLSILTVFVSRRCRDELTGYKSIISSEFFSNWPGDHLTCQPT